MKLNSSSREKIIVLKNEIYTKKNEYKEDYNDESIEDNSPHL